MTREPVPLRCDSCGEIIYNDQPYDEYGGDYESSPAPWHTACWESHQAKEEAERAKHRKYMADLRARPWDTLTYEERLCVGIDYSINSLVDTITAGGPDYFGPGGASKSHSN